MVSRSYLYPLHSDNTAKCYFLFSVSKLSDTHSHTEFSTQLMVHRQELRQGEEAETQEGEENFMRSEND